LNGHREVGDDGFQLLGDAARVSQVGNDEPRHPGQQRDRLGNVPSGRDLEVEQDRQVVTLAQFLTKSVEDLRRRSPLLAGLVDAPEGELDMAPDGSLGLAGEAFISYSLGLAISRMRPLR
jgi:hypothetical protein